MPFWGRPRDITGSGLSSVVAQQGRRSIVKSTQSGQISIGAGTTSQTATITAVDTAQAILINQLTTQGGLGSDQRNLWARGTITNTTTITATINADAGYSTFYAYQCFEYYTGVLRSNQKGTVTLANPSTTGTATVTNLDTTKTLLLNCGQSQDVVAAGENEVMMKFVVTNTTTITGSKNGAGTASPIGSFQAVEYF